VSIIDLQTARKHCRVYATNEDALIQLYLDAAERSAAEYMNRFMYADATALAAAIVVAPTTLTDALASIKVSEDAASTLTDCTHRAIALDAVTGARADAFRAYAMTIRGLVMNEIMQAACLLACGDLFENRQDSVIAVGVTTAVELPNGSKTLLHQFRTNLGI